MPLARRPVDMRLDKLLISRVLLVLSLLMSYVLTIFLNLYAIFHHNSSNNLRTITACLQIIPYVGGNITVIIFVAEDIKNLKFDIWTVVLLLSTNLLNMAPIILVNTIWYLGFENYAYRAWLSTFEQDWRPSNDFAFYWLCLKLNTKIKRCLDVFMGVVKSLSTKADTLLMKNYGWLKHFLLYFRLDVSWLEKVAVRNVTDADRKATAAEEAANFKHDFEVLASMGLVHKETAGCGEVETAQPET